MNKLAPIVLFVYNRYKHIKATIEALQKNELADESELFIYSDAAKNNNAIKNVDEVRQYIKFVNGFKNEVISPPTPLKVKICIDRILCCFTFNKLLWYFISTHIFKIYHRKESLYENN